MPDAYDESVKLLVAQMDKLTSLIHRYDAKAEPNPIMTLVVEKAIEAQRETPIDSTKIRVCIEALEGMV